MASPLISRRGQSTVEYMLYVSVIIIALMVSASALLPATQQGFAGLSRDAANVLQGGTGSGSGDRR